MDSTFCNPGSHQDSRSFLLPSYLEHLRLFDDPSDEDAEYGDLDYGYPREDVEYVDDLREFTEILSYKYFRLQRGAWIFRGHSSLTFELIPKVGRTTHTSKTSKKFLSIIFTMFKRSAIKYL
jgi:hypothetical protein